MEFYQMAKYIVLIAVCLGMLCTPAFSGDVTMKRFYHSGDGEIYLAHNKSGQVFKGRYRLANGQYDEAAYKSISEVFGAPYDPGYRIMSMRLVEFLDFLEDRLGRGALLSIISGYRAPEYNNRLRKRGALAAKASLHQYGMAADFILQGVPSKQIWNYVKSLNFGGTGYYHGNTVHVDVGPARFWDEKSSGVGSGLSDDNKLIGLVTDYDIYHPGEVMVLSFIRMTAFPVEVQPEFQLVPRPKTAGTQAVVQFKPDVQPAAGKACLAFYNIRQMQAVSWTLPSGIPPGRYLIRARFCDSRGEKRPDQADSPVFEVRLP